MHAWFMLFPTREWSCYLLAMVYAAFGLWIAWRLFARFLDPDRRVVALACLTLVPYFNFLGLRFDHNAVLGALWAATALCFVRPPDAVRNLGRCRRCRRGPRDARQILVDHAARRSRGGGDCRYPARDLFPFRRALGHVAVGALLSRRTVRG